MHSLLLLIAPSPFAVPAAESGSYFPSIPACERCASAESGPVFAVAAPENEAGKSVPIKHTRPKVQKFDNGFIIEDTHMGQAEGKVGSLGSH